MAARSVRAWWLVDLAGLLAIIFGVLLAVLVRHAGIGFEAVSILFGVFAAAYGVTDILDAMVSRNGNTGWWLQALGSVASLGAAFAAFLWVGFDNDTMLRIVAAWAIAVGAALAMSGMRWGDLGNENIIPAGYAGAILVLFGILLLTYEPEAGIMGLADVLGQVMTMVGVLHVIRAKTIKG